GVRLFWFQFKFERQRLIARLAGRVDDLCRFSRVHHGIRPRRDKSEIGSDFVQDLGMLMTTPLRLLKMFLRNHRTATRTMKSGAIDQAGLKGLELLTSYDVIVNVDNHDEILSV